MGKVDCFTIEGVTCWFWSQDHRPPHFHAKKRGQWHVRVWFLREETTMLEQMSELQGRISTHDRRTLQRMAAGHRDELLGEWERKVCHDD